MAQIMTETISLENIAPINTVSNNIGITRDDATRSHSINHFRLELSEQAISSDAMKISRGRAAVIIGLLFGTTIVGSFSTGLLTVGLPRMAEDLKLADNILLWYGRCHALGSRMWSLTDFRMIGQHLCIPLALAAF